MSIADLLLTLPKAGMLNVFVDERTVFVSRSVWDQLREEIPGMPAAPQTPEADRG